MIRGVIKSKYIHIHAHKHTSKTIYIYYLMFHISAVIGKKIHGTYQVKIKVDMLPILSVSSWNGRMAGADPSVGVHVEGG